MSYFDDASLVMIPSGYKDQKVYSVKPIDGSGDLTFSRASSATRVNSSGLVEKVRENLLLQSNSFDTIWTNSNTTETSGQSGYDGTNDAWKLDKSAAGGYITQSITLNAMQSFSVYAKAGTSNWVVFLVTGYTAYFDLTNGTVGTAGSAPITNIQSVGGGWYRCTLTASASTTSVRIYPAEGDGDTSGTSGNIYIQDAQLETGDIATDYIATTTTAVSVGPVSGLPRLDYSGGASCPSLLLEPQRSNLVRFSEQLSNAVYFNDNLTVTSNAIVSPDGYQNADMVTSNDSAQTVYRIYENTSAAGQSTGTVSAFMKYANHQYCYLAQDDYSGITRYAVFDLINGTNTFTSSGYSATITPYANGWYRVTLTGQQNTIAYLQIGLSPSSTGYAGTSIPDGQSAYFWGLQREYSAAYATSYIPTLSSAVTRVADSASKTGISSLIGQTAGTLFVEAYVNPTSNFKHIYNAEDATGAQNFLIYLRNNNRVRFNYSGGSFDDALLTEAGWHKYAITWSGSNVAMFTDGVKVASFTNLAKTLTFSVLGVGYLTSSPDVLGGGIKQALSFTSALSDADAITLTTL